MADDCNRFKHVPSFDTILSMNRVVRRHVDTMIQSMFLSAMGWLLDGIFWNRNNAQFGKLILNEG